MSFANLEKREKILIVTCGVVAVIFVSVFAMRGCGGARSSNTDLARLKKVRETFVADLARYRAINQTVSRIDSRLAATPDDYDVVGAMSAVIDKLSLRPAIRNLNPGETTGLLFFSEKYVDIDMQQIKLDDLVNLLKEINQSSAFLRVSQLSVKKRMGEEAALDVNIRVAAYGRKQPEPEAAP